MDNNLSENLKEIYRSLPLAIRETIFAPETTDAYDRVEKQYSLTKEQREILSVQCGLLMMGLILPQELVPILSRELKLPQEKTSLIAQDINREVFNLIKNELKDIHAISGDTTAGIASKTGKTGGAAPPASPASTFVNLGGGAAPQFSKTTPSKTGNPSEGPSSNSLPPRPAPLAAPSQSIFEQKLGGAFRIKSDATSHSVGTVTPPTTTPPATPLVPPPAAPKVDPYREEAI